MFLVAFGVHVGSPSACSQEAVPALLPSPLPLRDLPLPTWADGEGPGLGNGQQLGSLPWFKTQDKELDSVRVRTRGWGWRQSGYQIYICALITSAQESFAALPGPVVALTSGVWLTLLSQSEHSARQRIRRKGADLSCANQYVLLFDILAPCHSVPRLQLCLLGIALKLSLHVRGIRGGRVARHT